MKDKLKRNDFEVIAPLEYTANRTFVMRNIDSIISTVDSEELKSDIEERNTWLKITEIIKIPNAPKILKVKTESSEMVKKATELGVLIYNLSVPPTNIEKEIFVHLNPCLKCYAYEHKTQDCPKPATFTICSECSSNSHTLEIVRAIIKNV